VQTPNGNEYSIVDGMIHASIDKMTWQYFNSVEEVDLAFEEFKNQIAYCPLCMKELDSGKQCLNRACKNYLSNVNSPLDEYFKFRIIMTTTPDIPGKEIKEYKRILFSSSSELAGHNRQATRLRKTAESALAGLEEQAISIGANAIIGITISANSSQGGSAAFFGSSDAIIAMGTAVVVEEQKN